MNHDFGELTDVDLRKAWQSEPADFTLWLAENLYRLSSALGISPALELISAEFAVGNYSADIVARAPGSGEITVIENQLEWSDHTHLGQVLTYLAGTDAKIVVWVARDFRDEHLSAVRWLNNHTEADYAFFAVKVRVVQIADSPLVPVFDVLERPSEWDRSIRSSVAREESELTKDRREFWAYYRDRHPSDGVSPQLKDSNHYEWVESAEVYVALYLSQKEVGAYLRGKMNEADEELAARLVNHKQAIIDDLIDTGNSEDWRHAYSRLVTHWRDRSNWEEVADYLHDRLTIYRGVLDNPPLE